MRAALVLVFLAATGPTATAEDRETIIESLGALSIAPQICGFEIDRTALQAIGMELLPQEPELAAETSRVNNRIARQQGSWTTAERVAYCEDSRELAHQLGVMR